MGITRAYKSAIAITTDGAGDLLKSFLDYHFDLGFSHAFVFFDKENDPGESLLENYSNVTVFRPDAKLRALQRSQLLFESLAPHIGHELIARQMLNLETAIDFGNRMKLDWLFSLDDDELLCVPGGLEEFLSSQDSDIGQLKFLNHEAVPESPTIENYFEEVTLFKTSPHFATLNSNRPHLRRTAPLDSVQFNGYSIGKGAVRLEGDVLPLGSHSFLVSKSYPRSIECGPEATVYHYINCGLDRFVRKYERLGKFSDYYFGAPDPNLVFDWAENQQITLAFHKEARDTLARQGRVGMQALYSRRVQIADPKVVSDLIDKNILHRNESMRARIEQLKF